MNVAMAQAELLEEVQLPCPSWVGLVNRIRWSPLAQISFKPLVGKSDNIQIFRAENTLHNG